MNRKSNSDPSAKKRRKVAAQPPPLRNVPIALKLVLEYDGGCFFGCQLQPGQRTVQGEVERAVGRLTGETGEDGLPTIRMVLASRTDKGVHALGQVGLIRTKSPLAENPNEFKRRLNAYLPDDVVVVAATALSSEDGFDPRADAKGKWYRYTVVSGSVRPVLARGAAWYVPASKQKSATSAPNLNISSNSGGGVAGGGVASDGPNNRNNDTDTLNVLEMKKAALHLVGRPLDFSSFTNVVKKSNPSSSSSFSTKPKPKISFQENINNDMGDNTTKGLSGSIKSDGNKVDGERAYRFDEEEEQSKVIEYDEALRDSTHSDGGMRSDGNRSDSSFVSGVDSCYGSGVDSCYNSGAESDSNGSLLVSLTNNALANMMNIEDLNSLYAKEMLHKDKFPPRDPVCCISSIDINVVTPSISGFRPSTSLSSASPSPLQIPQQNQEHDNELTGGVPAFTSSASSCAVEGNGMMVHIDIRGSRFLYNMVRVIVGTIVEVGLGRLNANDMPRILEAKDRRAAGPGAPAKGLCLMQVNYNHE